MLKMWLSVLITGILTAEAAALADDINRATLFMSLLVSSYPVPIKYQPLSLDLALWVTNAAVSSTLLYILSTIQSYTIRPFTSTAEHQSDSRGQSIATHKSRSINRTRHRSCTNIYSFATLMSTEIRFRWIGKLVNGRKRRHECASSNEKSIHFN